MPGRLGQAVENWLFNKFQPEGGGGVFERIRQRFIEYRELWREAIDVNPFATRAAWFTLLTQGAIYVIFGWDRALNLVNILRRKDFGDISATVADAIHAALDRPEVQELTELFGTIVTEPVLTILEREITNPSSDPKEFARAFHGIMVGINTISGIMDSIAEVTGAGQIEAVGRMFGSMYWSLGLGFLGWQTLAPLLESGLQPGLERHYRRMARPQRFSASDLRDLHALGMIDANRIREEAKDLGWRDEDIERWIALAYRTLTQGEIWDAYHQGHITQNEASRRLRALGYDPKDIPLLFKLNPAPEQKSEVEVAAGTARQAFREGLISESELRSLLEAGGKSEREIDLIIGIEKTRRTVENRSLTVSQIKSAWGENVLTTPEARHWLEQAGFETDEIDLLIATWEREVAPEFRKLNLGTITGAYVEGIINRGQALEKLKSIGLTADDADLELKLVEARNPEAFGKIPPPEARKVTVSQLADIFAAGLITQQELTSRLVTLGYAQQDADLIAQSIAFLTAPRQVGLPQRTIERAYVAGVLDRQAALAELQRIGFSANQANVILDTLDAEEAETIAAPETERQKVLSAAMLEDLVIAGLLTPAQMRTRLIALGYSDTDADLLTARAAQLATPRTRALTQSVIERAYLSGVLNLETALQKLLELDFTPEDAATILATLEAENPQVFAPGLVQSFRLPSIGALAAAVQDGIITEDEFLNRAAEIGLRPDDARMYLTLATRQERKAAKTLSASQIINAYGAGLMPWGVALSRLLSQGYDNADAILLLRMEKDVIENSDAWQQMIAGNLDAFSTIAQLVNERYADEDILNAFAALDPQFREALGIDLQTLRQALRELPGGE